MLNKILEKEKTPRYSVSSERFFFFVFSRLCQRIHLFLRRRGCPFDHLRNKNIARGSGDDSTQRLLRDRELSNAGFSGTPSPLLLGSLTPSFPLGVALPHLSFLFSLCLVDALPLYTYRASPRAAIQRGTKEFGFY